MKRVGNIEVLLLLINSGPFGVIVAGLVVLVLYPERVPPELVTHISEQMPMLISVMVLIWVVTILIKINKEASDTHLQERADLVQSLSKRDEIMRELVEKSIESSTELKGVITELRNDMYNYQQSTTNGVSQCINSEGNHEIT